MKPITHLGAIVALSLAYQPSAHADVNLWLDPDHYEPGGYSTIGWSAPWATGCVASASPEYGPWSGPKGIDWAQSVAPDVSTVFTLTCTNGSRSETESINLTVTGTAPPPTPTDPPPGTGGGGGNPPLAPFSLWLSPDHYEPGGYSTIGWSAPGATDCVASAAPEYGPWSGHKQTDWAQSVAPNVSTVFTLTCTNGSETQTATTTLTVTGTTTPPNDPPPGNGGDGDTPPPETPISLSLSPDNYAVGGYSTLVWSAPWATGCVASAAPEYGPWSGSKAVEWGQSVAPNASTVFTLTCTNGTQTRTASTHLTVTGSAPPPTDPPPGGGGDGGSNPNPPAELPVPPVLSTPIVLTPAPLNPADEADAPLLNFAHTANREWNYDGHVVDPNFPASNGNWDYTETTYEPWLFDRPTSWYRLYQRTGNSMYRDYFLRDLAWYASHISADGYFTPKTGEQDTKYLYITPFVLYERDTGDTRYRDVAARIWQASRAGFPNDYSEDAGMWTEREVGLHLEAAVAYYELTGDGQALARAAALVRQWSQVAGTVGAPLVSYTRHEGGGPGGTTPTELVNSPWMSALYFTAARRYWQITGDAEVLRQVSAYFDWLNANGLYDGGLAHPQHAGVTFPRYLTPSFIGDGGYDTGNMNHCLDVAGLVAFAVDAKQRRGEDATLATQRYNELRTCAAAAFDEWTRPTSYLPEFRLSPPRMWNWWMRGSYESALH